MKNFLALLFFVGVFGTAGWYYYTKDTSEWIADISQQAGFLEQRIATQKAEIAAINRAFDVQRRMIATRKAIAILTEEQQILNAEKAELQTRRQKSRFTNRDSLVGVMLTNVVLADGRRLSQARVAKIDDVGVTFEVASGVMRVTPRELTPELRVYFQYSE